MVSEYRTRKESRNESICSYRKCKNTGLIEVPMGTSLREVIYDIGGGIKGDARFKAVQIGGPSGGCLITPHLDVSLDFDSLKKMGAMIGSGGLVVMDDKTCMVEVARFFMNFTQNESCGKCVPCREGTKRMLEILEKIVAGKGTLEDLNLLDELASMITDTALCGLGKSAALPVMSTLRLFRKEYEEHVVDKNVQQRTVQHYVVLLSVQSVVKDVQNVQETVRLVQSADRLKSRMLLMTVSVLNVVPVRVPVHSTQFI